MHEVYGVRIHYDSDIEDTFHVEYDDHTYDFACGGGGLYYYIMNPTEDNNMEDKTKHDVTQYSLYSTVNSAKEYFTDAEIKLADKARDTMHSIAWPGIGAYKSYLPNNLICNPPFTVDDINRAEKIYGPAVNLL